MPQKNNIELSIITPSYNEINVIEEFVFKLKKTFVGESVSIPKWVGLSFYRNWGNY